MLKSKRKIVTPNYLCFLIGAILLFFSMNGLSQVEKELEQLLNPAQKDSFLVSEKKASLSKKEIDTNQMVHVPAGNFIMGSDSFEIDERPVREVFLDEYWIDKYPVTNEQFCSFLNSLKVVIKKLCVVEDSFLMPKICEQL